MSKRVSVSVCQRRLAVIWFVGSGLILLLMLAQTLAGKYGGQVQAAWSWFFPTVLPTLSLILGAVVSEKQGAQAKATVDLFSFRISCVLSVVYVVFVFATLALQPFTNMTPLTLMNVANLWLGPIQGLVGIALGALFVSRQTS